VVLIGLVVTLAACGLLPRPPAFRSIDPTYTGVRITADALHPYEQLDLAPSGGSPLAQVSLSAAPTNVGGNLRAAFFPVGQSLLTDQQSCATWVGPAGPATLPQQGLLLRLRTVDRATSAITVTKNIWAGIVSNLNVNLWTIPATGPETLVNAAALDFSEVVYRSGPSQQISGFPWHVCARVEGPMLTVKLWAGDESAPRWDDPASTRRMTLSAAWVYPGNSGWYIGHLQGGMTFSYTNLAAGAPIAEPDPATTTSSTTTTTTVPVTSPSDDLSEQPVNPEQGEPTV